MTVRIAGLHFRLSIYPTIRLHVWLSGGWVKLWGR